mmetsp:Transcript_33467/g.58747  ORF Transcript_33467/g.58747 Transcript_33467/m.58747 type:complete len:587 (+) Transcript_33467:219-1979(+)
MANSLLELRTKYAQFSKNLKFLIATLTNNHASMLAYSKSRLEVAKAINSLTVDSPLFKCAGDIPANAVGTTDGGGEEGMGSEVVAYHAQPTSYAAIHLQLHKKNKMYADKYTEHILTYAKEWESILSLRVVKHLKQAEQLRVDLDHYGRKVEDLNKGMNKTMSKGKSINDKGADKMKRNEQKLIQARQEYDRFVNDLCGFMEEIMDRGWKDLHPLLVKMAQFDATLSSEEAMLLKGSMTGVTENLKGMAVKYPNLKPMGRLKELETWSLESLNKVNPGSSMRSDSPLMITHGGGENASYLTGPGDSPGGIHAGLIGPDSNDELNPGSVGGGGGPFGRQMSRTNSEQMSRTNSFASGTGSDNGYGQPRSRNDTGDSYDWAAGGPTHNSSSNMVASPMTARSASFRSPSSGGLPPLGPAHRAGSFHEPPVRAHSSQDMSPQSIATSNMVRSMQAAAPPPTLDDIFRSDSSNNMMAPAPAGMPPPPPSMPPPPPPQSMSPSPQLSQMSLYDGPSMQYGVPPPPMQEYMSPSNHSAASNTNPFDDDAFGAPPGGRGSLQGTPMQGNPYGQPHTPTHGNPYGGGAGTNPFG